MFWRKWNYYWALSSTICFKYNVCGRQQHVLCEGQLRPCIMYLGICEADQHQYGIKQHNFALFPNINCIVCLLDVVVDCMPMETACEFLSHTSAICSLTSFFFLPKNDKVFIINALKQHCYNKERFIFFKHATELERSTA